MTSKVVRAGGDHTLGTKHSTWMLIANENNKLWQEDSLADAREATAEELKDAPFWTDQRHNLVSVLRLW